jgi:hypothetical protein
MLVPLIQKHLNTFLNSFMQTTSLIWYAFWKQLSYLMILSTQEVIITSAVGLGHWHFFCIYKSSCQPYQNSLIVQYYLCIRSQIILQGSENGRVVTIGPISHTELSIEPAKTDNSVWEIDTCQVRIWLLSLFLLKLSAAFLNIVIVKKWFVIVFNF